ncbi:MAG: hypothetical protein SPL10_08160 [Synergistales bacterium]|nr:hypothetical protein [Synergistales bacterium]MDY6401073.1 hypothetical protein [Synergistales bacterium]MDY6404666.1 hypothetical protein [Synergistales bacterium]MDY6410918.1 hypothetical protein [Synergistales bacterium]MDY6415111.1 hypothetical protein [Synergistales bacterium]
MNKALLYIHGKGGNSQEVEQYRPYCINYDCCGVDFNYLMPDKAGEIILTSFKKLSERYEKIFILANSIGAYFSMLALQNSPVEKAFFISPILDMEKLILDMMNWAGVTEKELFEKGEIITDFGEKLSCKYLRYVRDNPLKWNIETEILYGEKDNLTSFETVNDFINKHNAKLTVMKNGEHWFHTPEQMDFLYHWLKTVTAN